MTPEDLKLQVFCETHDLENLIKEPTCFKGKNLSCIDLILTNQKQLFMKSRNVTKWCLVILIKSYLMKQLLLTLSANHFVNTTKKLKLKPTETASKELAQSEILDKYKDHH